MFIDLVDNYNKSSFNDEVTGYSMPNIENNIIPNSFAFSSVTNAVKNNKPSGVTDAQINTYMNLYFTNF